jgi:hypothetical protein
MDDFDYIRYSNTYTDLKKAFGKNIKNLKEHYYTHGKKEGRIIYLKEFSYDISILIPTMKKRRFCRNLLIKNIEEQIKKTKLKVELVVFEEQKLTIGRKREQMIHECNGKYCAFIDDDDIISQNYLKSFEPMFEEGYNYDCSSLWGSYYSNNEFMKTMHHSIQYSSWKEDEKTYYRNPNHLNLILSSICRQVGYENQKGEDYNFSKKLLTLNLCKNEYNNSNCNYFYVDNVKDIRNNFNYFVNELDNWKLDIYKIKPKILVKFPSKFRCEKICDILKKYILLSSKENYEIKYLITLDEDDTSLNYNVKENLNLLNDLKENSIVDVRIGSSKNKIDACNRDLNEDIINYYDIFLLASDDMIPITTNWADIIINKFQENFLDYDGVLHFNDGYTKKRLNTFCILGKKYIKSFGYFYNPDYTSFYCDNEFMDISIILNKYVYDSRVLFKHEHYCNTNNVKIDKLYEKNNSNFMKLDEEIYKKRKKNNFYLNQ